MDEQRKKQNDALRRAFHSKPGQNDVAAVAAFEARGIEGVIPRLNVFTFAAWKACGRSVMGGQKAVHVPIVKTATYDDKDTSEEKVRKYSGTAYLFHLSQTDEDPLWEPDVAIPEAHAIRKALGLPSQEVSK